MEERERAAKKYRKINDHRDEGKNDEEEEFYSHRCEMQEIQNQKKKTDSDALSYFSSFLTDFSHGILRQHFFFFSSFIFRVDDC